MLPWYSYVPAEKRREEGKVPFHVIVRVFDRKDGRRVSYRGLRNVVWDVDCV